MDCTSSPTSGEEPSAADRLLSKLHSHKAYTVGSFFDAKLPVTAAELLTPEQALAGYIEWIARGEDLFERELRFCEDNGLPAANAYPLYLGLLKEKKGLVMLLRSFKGSSSGSLELFPVAGNEREFAIPERDGSPSA